ncbi:MAG: DNA-3-methyladenine glycosylase I [Candidatus Cloacimonetes bacterium]|nr:DNA-3-methyladenine glycosylase I [Candidatus Cloacimonadota bacterium]
MEIKRCEWVQNAPEIYIKYHDEEWGVPLHDDTKLFELLVLEGAQAGLSWLTVLKKRENYRQAFDNFDYEKIADYDDYKILELLNNEGIIRNRLKIRSAIRNAKVFIKIREEFGSFDNYIWAYVDYKPIQNNITAMNQIPAKTELSDKISKDLKKRGMNFIGSTIIYAFMQSIGMVNDHEVTCELH